MGKGGEYLVASKLFFLNYSVSMPGVDLGADLLATKDGHSHYSLQIKTTSKRKNTYRARIKVSSFEKLASDHMFYVFVLRSLNPDQTSTETFLIFPHAVLEQSVLHNNIKSNKKYLFLAFTHLNDRFSMGSPDNDIGNYVNNWDIIG